GRVSVWRHCTTGLGGAPVRLSSHSSAKAASRHGPSGCRDENLAYQLRAVSTSPRLRRAELRQNWIDGSFVKTGPNDDSFVSNARTFSYQSRALGFWPPACTPLTMLSKTCLEPVSPGTN